MIHTEIEFDRVLTLIAMEAKSAPGKEAIARRRPLATFNECERAQAELAEMVRFYHREGLLPIAGLTDVRPLFDRETVLELEESWQIVRAARATQAIRETFLRSDTFPHLTEIANRISDLGELLTKSSKYFTRDGKLREEASAELRAIRQKVQQKRSSIQRVLNDVMNRSGDAIQEPLIVMRGDRFCIPVRADHRTAVPGILHERSGSGASFFIEPLQAVELNNDLADLLIQEREEIARITRYVSQMLFDDAGEIIAAVDAGGEFDALQACAVFSVAIHASRPLFSNEGELRILNGRHPLLDERLGDARAEAFGEEPSDRRVVPMTIELGARASRPQSASVSLDDRSPAETADDCGRDVRAPYALIISGPNAGGKTVALKTAGLLVAMGMSGLPVPADDGTTLPIVDAIHVLIGDDQSVLEHLSTFSAYLVRLKKVLAHATKRSLVLLDELGSGTDPEEGAALAASVVEHLLNAGSLLVVTTHLSSLKSFAVNDPRIVNASMEFDVATGQPTYRMITGIPGRSRAIDIAQMIGLPSSVIAAARERLGDRYGETDTLLATLQKRMSEVLAQQDEISRLRTSIEDERRAIAEKTAQLEKERASLGTSYRDELERLRDDVTRQLSNEIKILREKDRRSLDARESLKTVTQSIDRAVEFLPTEQREVRVGDKAEHRKFKVTGKVLSVDGSKAVLDVNGRRMTVDVRDLTSVAPATSPADRRRVGGATQNRGADLIPAIAAELNLIGQRVDDALEESDKFLDRALLEGKQAVRIIHGFGTGALRKAVREHLRKHPAVKSWRPGDENEGGDGATVAVLEG
ncbi:MAG TPA: Smr/MutS family protein [Thermoanaerobaculia bacterium]|nr:Smr/MutS family protein [Thermoanaerobaculia bacterium]